jgi:hypothetical protein
MPRINEDPNSEFNVLKLKKSVGPGFFLSYQAWPVQCGRAAAGCGRAAAAFCAASTVLSSALLAISDTSRRNLWLRIDVRVGIIVLRNFWSSAFTPVAGVQSCPELM